MRRFGLRPTEGSASCETPLPECRECALAACGSGVRALVLRMNCPAADACRLRALGVYEGARVGIVDARNGLLLDVRGSRLALDRRTAASIIVQPLAAA